MTEWTVVTVLIAVLGLITAVVKPMLQINTTIVRLDESVSGLQTKLLEYTQKHDEAHRRISQKNEACSKEILNHEIRLHTLEAQKNAS